MKKKGSMILCAVLFAAGILCITPLSAEAVGEQVGQAQSTETQDGRGAVQEETIQPAADLSGTCGENLTWTFDEASGTLTISGTGKMEDYSVRGPWTDDSFDVILDENNNIIGVEGDDKVKSVVIGDGVTSIGAYAFAYCIGLREITIPEGLASIGDGAFMECLNLKEAVLPDSVADMGHSVFSDCKSLREISLPDGIGIIDGGTFGCCSSLTDIVIPESVTAVDDMAFVDCVGLTKVTIPNGVTSLGVDVFAGCSNLKEIVLPDSINKIGGNAFEDCSSLTKVTIPDNLNIIEQKTFSGCSSLAEIVIPSQVSQINGGAFENCSSLKLIYFMGKTPAFSVKVFPLKGPALPDVEPFSGVTATVYYPEDPSWNVDTMKDYGGKLTWLRHLYIISEEAGAEVTDKVYVIGSGTDAAIKCSGVAEDFVSLAIDGKIVDPSYYKVESGSTILTVLSVFLDQLAVGDHEATLNYTYGSVDTVLTIIDKETNAETPGNTVRPTDPADGSGQTGTAGQQTGNRRSPQTGEAETGSALPLLSGILCVGGGAIVIRKRKMIR